MMLGIELRTRDVQFLALIIKRISSLLAVQKAYLVSLSKQCIYQAENAQHSFSPFIDSERGA